MTTCSRNSLALVCAAVFSGINASAAPPRINDVSPAPGCLSVDTGLPQVVLSFDQAVVIPADAVQMRSLASNEEIDFTAAYDSGSNTLTLQPTNAVEQDVITVTLDYTITNDGGEPLDGEVFNPEGPFFVSGNGQPGGQAVFRFNVLKGNVNCDGVVDDLDATMLVAALGTVEGDPGYTPLADLNQDGAINVLDIAIYQQGFGGMLPPTDGAGPSLLSISPANGARVRATELDEITVEFNEPLDADLISTQSLFVIDPTGSLRTPIAFTENVGPNGGPAFTFAFDPVLDLDGAYLVELSNALADPSGAWFNGPAPFVWNAVLDKRPSSIIRTSPANGEDEVAVTRETIIEFRQPISVADVTSDAFRAEFGGEILPVMLFASPLPDGPAGFTRKVTMFYQENLPASALVRVTVDGNLLTDDFGFLVDADGDGAAGGVGIIDFSTLTLTAIPGTSICGCVLMSQLGESKGGEPVNVPIAGATVTVDGAEGTLFAVTDRMGNFCLDPAPAGTFFVHIDGRDATVPDMPEGAYFPYVGKSWTSVVGQRTVLDAPVYLPMVAPDTLQEADDQDVTIEFPASVLREFPELAGTQIMVPGGSLFANDGTFGGQVGIAPVAPDRLPGTLPEGLDLPLVITVQTAPAADDPNGQLPTNFAEPVPVVFPNVPDPETGEPLPPGSKSALWSFDHDTGAWAVIGPMTVTDDGLHVVSDPGVGIVAPGWHGSGPGQTYSGGGGNSCGGASSGCDGQQLLEGVATVIIGGAAIATVVGASSAIVVAGGLVGGSWAIGIGIGKIIDSFNELQSQAPEVESLLAIVVAMEEPINEIRQILSEAYFLQGGILTEDQIDLLQGHVESLDNIDPNVDFATLARSVYFQTIELDPSFEPAGMSLMAASRLTTSSSTIRFTSTASGDYTVNGQEPFMVLAYNVDGNSVGSAAGPVTPISAAAAPASAAGGAPACGECLPDIDTPVPLLDYSLVGLDDLEIPDSDGDGLLDLPELIVGTQLDNADSDGDGVGDYVELLQGTDPLDGLLVQQEIIASADTPGVAKNIRVNGGRAVVAGQSGLSLFNVFAGMNPVIIAQVDTPGDAQSIAFSGDGNLLVVADGVAGVQVVDVVDPPAAEIISQFSPDAIGGHARCVATAGDLAYVGTAQGNLSVIDLQTEAVLSTVDLGDIVDDVAVEGGLLVALTRSELLTFDVFESDLATGLLDEIGAPGDVPSLTGRRRLFVGDDVAYVTNRTGYATYNVANPASIGLISPGGTAQFGWLQIAVTESNLGVAATGPNSTPDGPHDIFLYDTSDPSETDVFTGVSIETPGIARSVALYEGLAYVADSDAGLQVINFQPYDAGVIPPTIAVEATSAAGLVRNGAKLEEGTLLSVVADVTDDVLVREVELVLDDLVVQSDGDFPYQFFVDLPIVPGEETAPLSVQLRATDTGGNVGVSDPLIIDLTPDVTPPSIVAASPGNDTPTPAGLLELQGMNLLFDEAIDPAGLGPAAVEVLGAGPDDLFGTADDIPIGTNLSLVQQNRRLVVAPEAIPLGLVRLTVGGGLADDAGNIIDGDGDGRPGGDFVRVFETFDSPATVYWASTSGGDWFDPSNWFGGLPGPNDIVYLDVPDALATITFDGDATVAGIIANDDVEILGGSLTVLGDFTAYETGLILDATLTVDGVFEIHQNWDLVNAVIVNAWIETLNDAEVRLIQASGGVASNSVFDDVTLAGRLRINDRTALIVGGDLMLADGLILLQDGNGTPNPTDGAYLRFNIDPEQALTGTGEVRCNNAGTNVVTTGGETTLTIGPDVLIKTANASGRIGGNWINEGLIVADSGTIRLEGEWFNAGVISANENPNPNQSDGRLILDGTVSTAGLGTILNDGGDSVTLKGDVDNTGATLTLDANTGSWDLDGASISGGVIQTLDGRVLATTNVASVFSDVALAGEVEIFGNANISINGDLELQDGEIRLIDPNSGLDDASSLRFTSGVPQTVNGSGVIRFASGTRNDLIKTGDSPLTIGADVVVEAKSAPGRLVGSFLNQGVLLAENGRVIELTGGSTSLTNAGTIRTLNNGRFDIDTPWEQTAAGEIVMTLQSTAAPIFGSGSAVLDGQLTVEFGPGFDLDPVTSTALITQSGGVSGVFSTTELPMPEPDEFIDVSYTSNAVFLDVLMAGGGQAGPPDRKRRRSLGASREQP